MGIEESRHTIGDYVTLIRGTTYKGTLVGEPGPALLGLGSIEPGGGFREGHYKTYGGDCPAKLMLFPGDLYVALKGATKDGSMVGSVARVPEAISSGRLTQDTVKLEFKDLNPHEVAYIYWLLRTPQYRDYCANRVTGSAVAALSREDFLAYPVPPLTNARKQLVNLFDLLEDKIRINQQMNRTLEAIARALFKSWFIDFDPVRAKLDGRQPAGMDAETAALFPAEFEDSVLGKIPRGWKVGNLEEIADVIMGTSPKGDTYNEEGIGTPLVNGPVEFGDYFLVKRKWTTAPTRLSQEGDLIFCVRGSTTGRRVISDDTYCLGRGVCAIRGLNNTQLFINLLIELELERLLAKTTGSVFPNLSSIDLREFEILIPSNKAIEKYCSNIQPLIKQIWININQSSTLVLLRDYLLPKLLSSEICIKEAEKIVAEVV